MPMFLVGLVLFIGLHLSRVLVPNIRASLVSNFGVNVYRGLYSVLSIAALVILIYGFGLARQETGFLYEPAFYLAHITLLLMLIAFIVLVAGFLPTGYIALYTKHPQVLAVKIWAFAHLLANGETVQVILFSAFLAWGVILRISYARRERRGEIAPRVYKSWTYDVIAIVVGLIIYGLFFMGLHEMLIGKPVLVM
jgi:uncharacterized membrane protein